MFQDLGKSKIFLDKQKLREVISNKHSRNFGEVEFLRCVFLQEGK